MSVRILTGDCREVLRTRKANGQFVKGVHAYRKPQPHWTREWLLHEYEGKQRSAGDIAAEIGCTDANVLFWLKRHALPRRTASQARAVKYWGSLGPDNPMFGKTGAANPRYVDGGSPERQRLYVQAIGREFLKRIYARDGYRCARCGVSKAGPRSLHVHHRKPWAGHPKLRFDEANVVTLCRSCHSWVHSRKNVSREYMA